MTAFCDMNRGFDDSRVAFSDDGTVRAVEQSQSCRWARTVVGTRVTAEAFAIPSGTSAMLTSITRPSAATHSTLVTPWRGIRQRDAAKSDGPTRQATIEARRIADEVGDERGCRAVIDRVGSVDLLDSSPVHHRDAVGEVERFVLVVGDEDRRQPHRLVDAAQPAAEIVPDFRVERTERLVEEDAWVDRRRAGDRDALPLSAR